MADQTRIEVLIAELQERLDELAREVRPTRPVRERTARARANGPKIDPNGYDLGRVIPPTQTESPEAIVGGLFTRDFPDCCAVGDDTDFYCSGTLIAPNLVVTAKHCTRVRRVFLKGHNIARPETGEILHVKQEFAHPTADIRVLMLDGNSTVTPRHIAQGAEVRGELALLVGFGNIDLDGTFGYGRKRRVEVPIASLGCASPGDGTNFGCRGGTEMVAGHRGLARDSCTGDSGGPLYVAAVTGGYYLLGATSRGIEAGPNACGDGGIYVRVDQFVDWITEKTGVAIEGPLI